MSAGSLSNSRLGRFWKRVIDRNRPPRSWWYPRIDNVFILGDPRVVRTPEAVKIQRELVRTTDERYSETIVRAMLSLLAVALYCLVTMFGASDRSLLVSESTIKVPFGDAPVSLPGFLVVAPVLMIVIATYLHIYYGYWIGLGTDRELQDPPVKSLPALFSLRSIAPSVLTMFLFYWLLPIVLGVFTWKAAPTEFGRPMALVTSVVTAVFLFLQIRRCEQNKRRLANSARWILLLLVIAYAFHVVASPKSARRPFELERADLKSSWLPRVKLREARARYANFREANLREANLRDARLRGANFQNVKAWSANFSGAALADSNFQGADLELASFEGASLRRADLRGANLRNTFFYGAELQNADLRGANLEHVFFNGAYLQGADLRCTRGLQAQLQTAASIAGVRLPGIERCDAKAVGVESGPGIESTAEVGSRITKQGKN